MPNVIRDNMRLDLLRKSNQTLDMELFMVDGLIGDGRVVAKRFLNYLGTRLALARRLDGSPA